MELSEEMKVLCLHLCTALNQGVCMHKVEKLRMLSGTNLYESTVCTQQAECR